MAVDLLSWHCITTCGQKGTGKTNLIRNLLPNYQEVFVFDPLEEYPEYPHYIPEKDTPLELEKIAKIIWNRWNCLLVVSEAELFLPVNQTLPPNVFKILTRGRHRNVGMIFDTRRIANLNKTAFGLSEHVFIFRHFSPTDMRYLAQFVPQDPRGLANLADWHYWHYTRGRIEECPPLPLIKTITPSRKKAPPKEPFEKNKEIEGSE